MAVAAKLSRSGTAWYKWNASFSIVEQTDNGFVTHDPGGNQMTQSEPATGRTAGAPQALALILAMTLPVTVCSSGAMAVNRK